MNNTYSSTWWCDYQDTDEQYKEILANHPDIGTQNLTHIIIDYHYDMQEAMAQIETLKGRIYELEQTLDGREHEDEGNHTLTRSDWAWPEKEED